MKNYVKSGKVPENKAIGTMPSYGDVLSRLGFEEMAEGLWAANAPYEDAVVFGSLDDGFMSVWDVDHDQILFIFDLYPDKLAISSYCRNNNIKYDNWKFDEILRFCV